MNNTPVIFESDWVEPRSRATTFFRAILAIPHFIVLCAYGFVAFFALVAAWFALVITGRYPEGIYGFLSGFLRYSTATYGYLYLLTDQYPPFGPTGTDDYPVRLRIGPPKAEYNRLHTFFRAITAIPVLIVNYAMQLVAQVGAFIAWFAIVILGRQVKGLQEMIELGLSYQQRSMTYMLLLNEDWFPPITSPPAITGTPAPTEIAPSAPPPASPLPPTGLSSGDPLAG